MNAKHREALRKNRIALVESLRVEDIRSHMIQDGVLTISHFQSITAKPTRKERAEEFLDILVTRGPNAFKAFTRALRYDYSFLYASLMGKGTERELDLVEENKVLKDENKTLKQPVVKTLYNCFTDVCDTQGKGKPEKLLYPAKAPKSLQKGQKTINSKIVSTQKQQTVKMVKEEAAPRIQTAKLTAKQSGEEMARPKSDGALQVQQHNSGESSQGAKSAPLSKTSTTKIITTKPVFLDSHKSTSSTSAKETTVSKTNNKALTTKGNTNTSPSKSPTVTEKETEAPTVTLSYSLLSETTTPKQVDVEDYDQTQHVCQHTVETEDVEKRKTTQKETGTLQKDCRSPSQTGVRERSAVKTQNSGTEADVLQKPAQGTPASFNSYITGRQKSGWREGGIQSSARPKQAPPTLRNVKETQKASGEKRSQTTQQSSKRRGSVIKIRFEEGRLSRVDIREDNDDTDSASATGSCP
ncbi:DNA-directed RNA polymerase III subunit RPC4 [Branchiostoma belcheri]|nr:DNA-directed RNA polymerase III subunit RPC4 [Branchiostoma belcheri]